MTQFLLRIFVKNHEETGNPDIRKNIGSLASWTSIILNILLVVGKTIAGIISGSVSIIADGLNNLMDTAGSLITLIGFKISDRKADKDHPYGHGRFEYIAGFIVAISVLLVGIELSKTSINKIINPTAVDYGWVTLVILVLSVLLKLWMSLFSKNLGDRISSTTLIALSADSRNDAIATTTVFITALVSRFANINIDGWAGLGVGVFIVYNGFTLIKETISPLLGEAPSDELVNNIIKKIESYDGILGVHDLIVHDYGPGRQYASAHVELYSHIDSKAVHSTIDEIEKDFLKENNINLVIHYDPVEYNHKRVDSDK